MECNKEEALRAKQVAETHMQSNDFAGALRFAQKAQRLYPQLEGIAQMLAVCEVHSAAEKKLGSEADWYAILQIETAADEITIKKQYRKLALLLHPDKNKFYGSEAAFKVIVEANRVLTDKGKRSLYDVKRKSSVTVAKQKHAAHQSTQNASFSRQFSANVKPGNTSSSLFPGGSQPQQTEDNAFWTMCSLCKDMYKFLSQFLHKAVLCQSCKKPFIALKVDVSGKDVPNGGSSKVDHIRNHPSKSKCDTGGDGGARVQANAEVHMHAKPENKGREVPKIDPTKSNMKSGRRKRGRKCPTDSDSDSEGMDGKSTSESLGNPARRSSRLKLKQSVLYDENLNEDDGIPSKKSKADTSSHVSDDDSKPDAHTTSENKGREIPKIDPTKVKPQEKGNMKSGSRKRGRKCPTDSDAPSEGMDGKSTSESLGNSARRSSRPKQSVCYDENLNEDDGIPSKKSKADTSSHVSVDDIKQETDDDSVAAEENGKSKPDADTPSKSDSCSEERKVVVCPDPEFSDFDKDKAEGCFAAGQVWACYDSVDSMPRFYSKVLKVSSPGFRLKYTCFMADPDDDAEKLWSEEDLPVACGKYRRGKTEETTDILIFSHQMHLISGESRGSFLVYPRKGETWALFKNWDIKWSSEPEKHTSFDFDYVEVLSDFDKETGINVAPLFKVKGFVSLFKRSDMDQSFQISKCDLYRFSHRIPSFKMTGKEKKGVPVGSFEFDTAALPVNAGNVTNGDEVGGEPCVRRSPRVQEKITRADDLLRKVQSNKHKDTVMEDAQKSGTSTSKSDEIPPSKVGNASMSTPKKIEEKNIKPDTSTLKRSPRGMHRRKGHKDTVMEDAQKSGTSKSDDIPPSKVGNASMSTPKKIEAKNIKPDTSTLKRSPRGMHRRKGL